jgi:hypothetical protein
MTIHRISVAATAIVLATSMGSRASAQGAPPAAEPYRPGLGDLMTMTVQPRHIKLALAGRESNWSYAKYELHELQEAFERVTRVWPRFKGLPLGGMVDAIAKGPMTDLGQAIEAKSSEQFAAAFPRLTEGCNACHQAANVGMVVIKSPDASSFPDQDFRPQKP